MGTTSRLALTSACSAVHPHGRGDNSSSLVRTLRRSGSPPRAWGQLRRRCPRRRRFRLRFTPTGVGTTARVVPGPAGLPVHPHGRGDNAVAQCPGGPADGSPPRAWGQPRSPRPRPQRWRFTPTGVGTTQRAPWPSWKPSVHPHGRGDNPGPPGPKRVTRGSPPRAWGQPGARPARCSARRFTPTGVGTTSARSGCSPTATVHPHGRGDNVTPSGPETHQCGSPPRAWGQLLPPSDPRAYPRFTPTGVGTTRSDPQNMMSATVHPHGRGDNSGRSRMPLRQPGSPPRAWGQRRPQNLPLPMNRFTPTGVGTTAPQARSGIWVSVHPHGRGDNPQLDICLHDTTGSPPRAWGQRASWISRRH